MSNKIQIKRGVQANLPLLSAGEPAFTTDTKRFYIGDGTANIEFVKSSSLNGVALSGSTVDLKDPNAYATLGVAANSSQAGINARTDVSVKALSDGVTAVDTRVTNHYHVPGVAYGYLTDALNVDLNNQNGDANKPRYVVTGTTVSGMPSDCSHGIREVYYFNNTWVFVKITGWIIGSYKQCEWFNTYNGTTWIGWTKTWNAAQTQLQYGVPGYQKTPDGFIDQWTQGEFQNAPAGEISISVYFPYAFPSECVSVSFEMAGASGTNHLYHRGVDGRNVGGVTLFAYNAMAGQTIMFYVRAKGY